MKNCNCTYWERMARKMARLHMKFLTEITKGGVTSKTVEASYNLARAIKEAKP